MPLSDREVKNVLGFYVVLRNVVLIAGVVVIVAAVVAVIAGAYNIGRKNGNAEAAAAPVASGEANPAPKPKPRARAKSQEETEALKLQEAEETAGHTKTDLGLGEDDAKTTESGAETRPEARPEPSAVQRPDASAGGPAPAPGVVGRQTFVDAFGAPTSDTTPMFSVTVHQKTHGWPRRFFGAIGRGVGKAFRVR
jgi:hypothetical protein